MEKQTEPFTVEQAREALAKISTHRAQLVASRMGLNNRLEASRDEAAERYLRGDRGGFLEANAIGAELETIERALGMLDQNERVGKIELQRAEARELREEAARKRSELEALAAKTGELLQKLSQLEGVPYSHSILSTQPSANMVDPSTLKAPAAWLPVLDLLPNVPGVPIVHLPLSRRLRMEVEELEAKALSIEHRLSVEKAA